MPDHNRRKNDNCCAKRLWESFTPYPQIGGYAVLLASIIAGLYLSFCFVYDTQAYEDRIHKLETFQSNAAPQLDRIEQRIQDITDFWKIPHKE